MNRIGVGYDVHQLVEGRKCILGGVEIPYERGLDGHSDADVLIHAIADAVLGALGEVDIGHYFPNTDPKWKGIRSTVFLEEIARVMKEKGATLMNIDSSLVGEEPKISKHIPAMKEHIAKSLGVTVGQVGIKATTNEKMGFLGRGEGIAAMAVALIEMR
ncbi:MAG: 2-C-methyl-D-erythritol 2,4-cyclodiphosphate synthase [Verrucomicrobiota bacterium]|nr:2-C-methyl-D-erythritol 2,4-cyclodiphosphate synthase [Verrucomicrobiota bacterium]